MSAARRILRRLQLAAPWKLIAPLAFVFLLWQGMLALLDERDEPEKHLVGVVAIDLAVALFAAWRAIRNNPYSRPGYRAWLATTPWTVDGPLPFGPAELDWPDVVVLGMLMGLNGMIPEHRSARILALFFFFHALTLAPTIFRAANHVPAYATFFGLGLMARLWDRPWACALTGVVVYLIVYDGLRITLRKFPEPGDVKTTSDLGKFDPDTAPCGWPYDRLLREPGGEGAGDGGRAPSTSGLGALPRDRPPGRPRGKIVDDLAWSLLIGWWVSSLGPILFPGDRYAKFLFVAVAVATTGGGLIRLAIYTGSYQSPISAWGRIRTFRWIIPGYDVVFTGPLLAAAAPSAVVAAGLWREIPWEVVGPTAITSALFVALAAPPGLRRWRLVGKHRMTPGRPMSSGVED